MLVLGALLAVGGVAAWVVGAVFLDDAVGEVSTLSVEGSGGLEAEADVPGELDVDLDIGGYTVYAIVPDPDGPASTTIPTPTDSAPPSTDPAFVEAELDVTVTGPDGEVVPVSDAGFPFTYPDGTSGLMLVEVVRFDADVAGAYTVAVDQVEGSPPVVRAGVGPEIQYDEALGKGLTGGGFLILGFFLGGVGGVLLLAGFIWLLVSSSSTGRRPPPYGPPPGQWGPPPGQWGPPPGQWGPPAGQWGPPPSGQWGPPPGPSGPSAGGWGPRVTGSAPLRAASSWWPPRRAGSPTSRPGPSRPSATPPWSGPRRAPTRWPRRRRRRRRTGSTADTDVAAVVERVTPGPRWSWSPRPDAGTSVPAARLVGAVVDAGLPVEVVPAPVAAVAALVASGLATDHIAVDGVLPPPARTGRPGWPSWRASAGPTALPEAGGRPGGHARRRGRRLRPRPPGRRGRRRDRPEPARRGVAGDGRRRRRPGPPGARPPATWCWWSAGRPGRPPEDRGRRGRARRPAGGPGPGPVARAGGGRGGGGAGSPPAGGLRPGPGRGRGVIRDPLEEVLGASLRAGDDATVDDVDPGDLRDLRLARRRFGVALPPPFVPVPPRAGRPARSARPAPATAPPSPPSSAGPGGAATGACCRTPSSTTSTSPTWAPTGRAGPR